MRNVLLFLIIGLFLFSCQKEDISRNEKRIEKRNLTNDEVILKNNLDNAAKILAEIVSDRTVQRELRNFSTDKNDQFRIPFNELLKAVSSQMAKGDIAKPSSKLIAFREKFTQRLSIQGAEQTLVQYLDDNNCSIYIPYPIEWYSEDTQLTVSAHPIDNDIEGVGYISDGTNNLNIVSVDEDYADRYPVMLVMPPDPEDPGSGGGGGGGSSTPSDPPFGVGGSGPNKLEIVYINYVWCRDYCGGLFEGPVNLRIKRIEPVFDPSTQTVTVADPVEISISYPRSYVKAARKGWTQHSNGGWLKVNATWDTNWAESKDRQGILAYDYDWDASVRKMSVGVSYKGVGVNVSLERDIEYKGDFLGKNDQWWRSWFYATQSNPTPYDQIYNGFLVRTLGDLRFTTPTYTLYY
jgi:hypothetical protein